MKQLSCILVLCLLLGLFAACGAPTRDGGGTDTTSAEETLTESASETEGETEPPTPTAKERYYIMLVNSAYLSRSDQNVVATLPALYPTHDVFVLDVRTAQTRSRCMTVCRWRRETRKGRLTAFRFWAVPTWYRPS